MKVCKTCEKKWPPMALEPTTYMVVRNQKHIFLHNGREHHIPGRGTFMREGPRALCERQDDCMPTRLTGDPVIKGKWVFTWLVLPWLVPLIPVMAFGAGVNLARGDFRVGYEMLGGVLFFGLYAYSGWWWFEKKTKEIHKELGKAIARVQYGVH